MTPQKPQDAEAKIERLLDDVGRLRRLTTGEYADHLCQRIGDAAFDLFWMFAPTAHDLYCRELLHQGREGRALQTALHQVDQTAERLQRRYEAPQRSEELAQAA